MTFCNECYALFQKKGSDVHAKSANSEFANDADVSDEDSDVQFFKFVYGKGPGVFGGVKAKKEVESRDIESDCSVEFLKIVHCEVDLDNVKIKQELV